MNNHKIGVACVLIDWVGNPQLEPLIWLSKRLGQYETGKYACPGGMVDDTDESDVHAIQREVFEETGIRVEDLTRFERSIVSEHPGGKSDVTQWFILRLERQTVEGPENMEPSKHGPWQLFSLRDAADLQLMVSTKDVLATL